MMTHNPGERDARPADAVEVPAELVEALRNARAQEAQWAEIAGTLRSKLEELIGEHETATVNGQPAIRWTRVKSTRLNQTLLKSLHPDAYAECQTVSTSRRFTLVDPA